MRTRRREERSAWPPPQSDKCNDGCAGGYDLDFFRHGLKRDRSDVVRIPPTHARRGFVKRAHVAANLSDALEPMPLNRVQGEAVFEMGGGLPQSDDRIGLQIG